MDEKEKILDELFVSEDEIGRPKHNVESTHSATKDTDSKSINNAVNELSKEFDKKNKEELNKRKKEEGLKAEVEKELANDGAKKRKSKVASLLSVLSFPFVLLGGILVWNFFIAEKSINPLAILTVLMCVSGFAVGVKSFIDGIMMDAEFKKRIKPLGIGVLAIMIAVLIIIFRAELEKFAFLIAGIISAVIAFIALMSSALKKNTSRNNITKIVFSGLSFIGSILLILAGAWLGNVVLYLQITGIYLVLVGCSLFIY